MGISFILTQFGLQIVMQPIYRTHNFGLESLAIQSQTLPRVRADIGDVLCARQSIVSIKDSAALCRAEGDQDRGQEQPQGGEETTKKQDAIK